MSPLLCKLPVKLKIFLAFTSRLANSCSFHSSTSTNIVRIGSANVLYSVTLFLEYNSDSRNFLALRRNSLLIFSLFKRPSYPMSSSTPRFCKDPPPQAH